MTPQLRALLKASKLPVSIGDAFDDMGVAEELIAEHYAAAKSEGEARLVWNSFLLLQKPELLRGYAEALYRAHCREILTRRVAREDTRPGTHAECLVLLSRASLKAPLSESYAALMEHCFEQAFRATVRAGGQPPREGYKGERQELLTDLRRKTEVESRTREDSPSNPLSKRMQWGTR